MSALGMILAVQSLRGRPLAGVHVSAADERRARRILRAAGEDVPDNAHPDAPKPKKKDRKDQGKKQKKGKPSKSSPRPKNPSKNKPPPMGGRSLAKMAREVASLERYFAQRRGERRADAQILDERMRMVDASNTSRAAEGLPTVTVAELEREMHRGKVGSQPIAADSFLAQEEEARAMHRRGTYPAPSATPAISERTSAGEPRMAALEREANALGVSKIAWLNASTKTRNAWRRRAR